MAAGRRGVGSRLTWPGRKSAAGAIALASAVACAVVAASGHDAKPPTAVAGALPHGYRVLLTEEHGKLHMANYGRRGTTSAGDGPLTVTSIRGSGKARDHELDHHRGDRRTTVRGHRAVMRKLTDEGRVYARELVWVERRDLVISVTANLALGRRKLRRVAEGVRILDPRAWARLYVQTSYDAQIGRVTPDLRRLRVTRGRLRGHRWRLDALTPPRYPLSRDDLRVSCVELRYRGGRANGNDCGVVANWQRVGGAIFVFGEVGRRVKHVRIRPYEGHAFDLRVRTRRARRGPRVRYFATPLPEGACAVRVTPAGHPHVEGSIAAPLRGRDRRRCARGT